MTTSPLTPSQGLFLRGWVDLTCGRETLAKKSIKFFEEALAGPENPKPVDALFSKARFYLMRYNFQPCTGGKQMTGNNIATVGSSSVMKY